MDLFVCIYSTQHCILSLPDSFAINVDDDDEILFNNVKVKLRFKGTYSNRISQIVDYVKSLWSLPDIVYWICCSTKLLIIG